MRATRRLLAGWWRQIFVVACALLVVATATSATDARFGIVAAVLLFAAMSLWIDARLRSTAAAVRDSRTDALTAIRADGARIGDLETGVADLRRDRLDVEGMSVRLEELQARLDAATWSARLDDVEARIDRLADQIAASADRIDSVRHRVKQLDDRLRDTWLQRLSHAEQAVADVEDVLAEYVVTNDSRLRQIEDGATTEPSRSPDPTSSGRTGPRPVRLYWWRHPSRRLPNFGDELSPVIVESLAGRPVVHAGLRRCDLVAIGSVLEHVRAAEREAPVPVWGAGFIAADTEFRAGTVVPHAVRGRLSAERVGGSVACGDPGLLARHLVEAGPKRYAIGLVPHYVDRDHPMVRWFEEHVPDSIVISPLQDPLEAIGLIASCDAVISSSLHGIVVADSYAIPNRWVQFSDDVVGSGFKFRDHLSNFGLDDAEPARLIDPAAVSAAVDGEWMEQYTRHGIDDLIDDLVAAFPDLD